MIFWYHELGLTSWYMYIVPRNWFFWYQELDLWFKNRFCDFKKYMINSKTANHIEGQMLWILVSFIISFKNILSYNYWTCLVRMSAALEPGLEAARSSDASSTATVAPGISFKTNVFTVVSMFYIKMAWEKKRIGLWCARIFIMMRAITSFLGQCCRIKW